MATCLAKEYEKVASTTSSPEELWENYATPLMRHYRNSNGEIDLSLRTDDDEWFLDYVPAFAHGRRVKGNLSRHTWFRDYLEGGGYMPYPKNLEVLRDGEEKEEHLSDKNPPPSGSGIRSLVAILAGLFGIVFIAIAAVWFLNWTSNAATKNDVNNVVAGAVASQFANSQNNYVTKGDLHSFGVDLVNQFKSALPAQPNNAGGGGNGGSNPPPAQPSTAPASAMPSQAPSASQPAAPNPTPVVTPVPNYGTGSHFVGANPAPDTGDWGPAPNFADTDSGCPDPLLTSLVISGSAKGLVPEPSETKGCLSEWRAAPLSTTRNTWCPAAGFQHPLEPGTVLTQDQIDIAVAAGIYDPSTGMVTSPWEWDCERDPLDNDPIYTNGVVSRGSNTEIAIEAGSFRIIAMYAANDPTDPITDACKSLANHRKNLIDNPPADPNFWQFPENFTCDESQQPQQPAHSNHSDEVCPTSAQQVADLVSNGQGNWSKMKDSPNGWLLSGNNAVTVTTPEGFTIHTPKHPGDPGLPVGESESTSVASAYCTP